jgi:LmbE family N-acetylglucosaminyl deacetylase
VAAARTLLAVHAHADDETITMGGTLARYGAEGVRTVVVTCTRGDLGTIFDPDLAGQDVTSLRECELRAATRALGVSRLVQLGYSDSGMAGWPENDRPGAFWAADLSEAADRLLGVIEQERPTVMLAYDETGGYGHPDHLKAHQVAVAAFQQASARARPTKFYFVRFPLSWSRSFVGELRAAGIAAPGSAPSGANAGPDVPEIGVADGLVTTAIDVRGHLNTKLSALACYASQVTPDHFLRRMPIELAERLWAYEYYSLEAPGDARAGHIGAGTVAERLAAGALGADLFASLD